MATNRYVSTSFWDDEWIQTLDPSEKLVYLYFMTNPLTNIAGVYKLTAKRISFDTGFTLDTISHIMGKFEKSKKVYRFGEWVILPSWPKHQKVSEKDNNRKGIDAILLALPDEIYSKLYEIEYKYIYLNELGRRIEGASIPLQGASMTSNYINLNINSNSNIKSNIIAPKVAKQPFIPPTLAELTAYAKEKGYTIDCKHFLDYYESNDWRNGKDRPVKNWKQTMTTWQSREQNVPAPVAIPKCPACGELMYEGYCKNAQCPDVIAFFDDPERDKEIAKLGGMRES